VGRDQVAGFSAPRNHANCASRTATAWVVVSGGGTTGTAVACGPGPAARWRACQRGAFARVSAAHRPRPGADT
jgi:hypothetical protein